MGTHSSKGPRKRLFGQAGAVTLACAIVFGGLLPALPAFATDGPTTESTSTAAPADGSIQQDDTAPAEPTTEAPAEDTPSDVEAAAPVGGDLLEALRVAPAAATTLTFDWDWKYADPTCTGLVIAFPADLPDSQSGVIEVNVTGGSLSGRNYKLEGDAYTALYPHGHAGQTVTILWTDPLWRNVALPATGTWTITGLQVHGTNYHWAGSLTCGSDPPPITQKYCDGGNNLTWTRNANLSEATVTLKSGINACDITLHSFDTDGPTWETSGTQDFVDFDSAHLTAAAPTATVKVDVRGCDQQQDLAIGTKKHDGIENPLPHYDDAWFPEGLIDHWNGSAPCDPIDQPCTRVAPDKSKFAPNPDETGPAMVAEGAAFSKGTLLHTPVTVPLAGINGLGYTIVSSDGYDASYKMEILSTGTGGYMTLNWSPGANGYANDATGTFSNLEDGLWSSSRISTGPGSLSDPITLDAFELLYTNANIISYGAGQGTTTNATSVVSDITFLCGTTPFGEEEVELTKVKPALPYKYCPTEPTSSPQQPTVVVPGVQDPAHPGVWVGDHGVTNLAEDTVTNGVGIQRYETTPLDGEEFEESTDGSYVINLDGSITTILTFDGTPCPYTTPPILVGPTFSTLSCPAPADKPVPPVLSVPGVQDADDATLWHSDDFDTKISGEIDPATGLGTVTETLTPHAGKAFEESDKYTINEDGTITHVLTGTGLCPAKDKPSGGANFGASGDEMAGMQQSVTTQVTVATIAFFVLVALILALLVVKFGPRLRARFGASTN